MESIKLFAGKLKADMYEIAVHSKTLFHRFGGKYSQIVPENWKEVTVIKLPQRSDVSICSDCGGISLMSIPAKLFGRVITNISKSDKKVLRDEQTVFQSDLALCGKYSL